MQYAKSLPVLAPQSLLIISDRAKRKSDPLELSEFLWWLLIICVVERTQSTRCYRHVNDFIYNLLPAHKAFQPPLSVKHTFPWSRHPTEVGKAWKTSPDTTHPATTLHCPTWAGELSGLAYSPYQCAQKGPPLMAKGAKVLLVWPVSWPAHIPGWTRTIDAHPPKCTASNLGHNSFQSIVISHNPCHWVIMSRLEIHFAAALRRQQLGVFLFCASVTTHSLKPIFNQYKMQVGQRCIRAHRVTINSYHLVKGWA